MYFQLSFGSFSCHQHNVHVTKLLTYTSLDTLVTLQKSMFEFDMTILKQLKHFAMIVKCNEYYTHTYYVLYINVTCDILKN